MRYRTWSDYFGPLASTVDTDVETGRPIETRLFGFENVSDPSRTTAAVADDGACFGFVSQGEVEIVEIVESGQRHRAEVGPQQFFATAGGLALRLAPATRVVVSQRVGYLGLRVRGGPLEAVGRLRYIDGCSDTVLVSPARLGDPCFNHLHFPPGVEQTEHHHPSVRTGVVARGQGWCDTSDGRTALRPGLIFCIPANARHRFVTPDIGTPGPSDGRMPDERMDDEGMDDEGMDVVAFHPDSDFGPTDENHPMINRTWTTPSEANRTSDA